MSQSNNYSHGDSASVCEGNGLCDSSAAFDVRGNGYLEARSLPYLVTVVACLLFLFRKPILMCVRLLDLLKLLIIVKRCGKHANDGDSTWSVLDEWRKRVESTPDRPFLELVVDARNERAARRRDDRYDALTFRETDQLSDALARSFLKLLLDGKNVVAEKKENLSSPACVAVMLPSSCFFVANYIGLVKAGASACLVNTNLRGTPLAQAIGTSFQSDTNSGTLPRILLVQENLFRERFQDKDVKRVLDEFRVKVVLKLDVRFDPTTTASSPNDVVSIDRLLADDENESTNTTTLETTRPLHTPRWDSVFFYVFTSGTTGGKAKASIIRHIRYLLSGHIFAVAARLTTEDRVYCALPLYHSAAGMVGVCGCVLAGSCLVVRPKFSASAFASDLRDHRCTVVQYIGEFARYALSAEPDETSETELRRRRRTSGSRRWWWRTLASSRGESSRWNGVRVAFGNGMRPEIWEPFQRRFGIGNVVEFYASTEGNANILNNTGKVGSIGCVPNFVLPFYPICLVKCDPLTGDILRDPKTQLAIPCGANEPGQLLGLISRRPTEQKIDPARMFEGYTDDHASKRKIVVGVRNAHDKWFATGDILRKDWFGFYYWVDRVGDTFRWKGENVSTCEVAAAIMGEGESLGIFDVNVYGVEIPGYPGRAGMARISLVRGAREGDVDLRRLYSELESQLASYARPIFLRFAKPEENDANEKHATSTFKQMKGQLREQGFHLSKCDGELVLIRDDKKKTFRILTEALYNDVCNSKIRL